MIFKQVFDQKSSTYTYLIASSKGREALIIDPVLEAIHFNFDEKTPKQPKIIFKVDKNMKNQKFTVGRAGQNNSKDLLLTSSSINTH